MGTIRYHVDRARPSTFWAVNRYLEKQAAGGDGQIAAEVLSVALPTAREAQVLREQLFPVLRPEQREALLRRPAYAIDYLPMYTVHPERTRFYYDLRHLLAHDGIVVSQAVRVRYQSDPLRFAPQLRFYDDLERYGTLVHRFGPDQGLRGPEIGVYRVSLEGADALLRSRGPLPDTVHPAELGPVSPGDLHQFAEGVARAAYAKGQWSMAGRYYRIVEEVGAQTGMSPIQLRSLRRLREQIEQHRASETGTTPGMDRDVNRP